VVGVGGPSPQGKSAVLGSAFSPKQLTDDGSIYNRTLAFLQPQSPLSTFPNPDMPDWTCIAVIWVFAGFFGLRLLNSHPGNIACIVTFYNLMERKFGIFTTSHHKS
jgi:hypothetical protein